MIWPGATRRAPGACALMRAAPPATSLRATRMERGSRLSGGLTSSSPGRALGGGVGGGGGGGGGGGPRGGRRRHLGHHLRLRRACALGLPGGSLRHVWASAARGQKGAPPQAVKWE